MAKDADEIFETPETDDETTEIENDVLAEGDTQELDVEPEPEDMDTLIRRAEREQEFARYELSFRARRIREMTRTPIRRKSSRSDGTPDRTTRL